MNKILTLFLLYLFGTSLATCYSHAECGDSPTKIYKQLAKSVGK